MKKRLLRVCALALAAVLLLGLTACGGGGGSDQGGGASSETGSGSEGAPVASDRVLNVAVGADSGSLIPLSMSGDNGMQNAALTYMDDLFTYESDHTTLRPNLVTGWDMVSDIEYTVHLREGVTFSNGNPFTAEDVIFSMNLVATNPLHALAVKSVDFERTNIIDDYTIDLWLTKYDVGHWPGISIMIVYDAESFDPDDSLNPVGTGPYVIEDYVVNSHLTVTARDDYWGDPVQIQTITFHVIPEDAQRVNALTTETVDIAKIPLKDVEYVESLGNYTVMRTLPGQAAVAFFNMSDDCILNTPEKRQAICYAIDNQSICDLVYSGQTSPVGWPLTSAMTDLEDDMLGMTDIYSEPLYDLERAGQMVEELGLVGETLTIVSNGEEQYTTAAEIIQASLREIGMDAEIVNYDSASYMSIIGDPSTFDIALWFTSSPAYSAVDSLNMYPQFVTMGWTGQAHDDYIALSTQAVSTVSAEERAPLLRELLALHEEYVPWYAYADMVIATAVSNDIGGMQMSGTGGISWEGLYWLEE